MNPATGEIGYAGITSPGNAPSALTVGSLRTRTPRRARDDEVSPFSSRGPTWYDGFVKPDMLAPGQALVATATATSKLLSEPGAAGDAIAPATCSLSGTSMAAGVASGVVALMIEANRRDEGRRSVADAEHGQGHPAVHGDSARRRRPDHAGGARAGHRRHQRRRRASR